ncbi:hypothetical protein DFH07DRAFT_799682 [Mycena maculata]|uniref:Uncharacterized protein n=1 Tax=Mycena maculata TaxID=230809 RepID=A0AAD7K0W1_9AGAR|nr:hypothetical protein DFH07DRAFT_799682 [Mycena maculata]
MGMDGCAWLFLLVFFFDFFQIAVWIPFIHVMYKHSRPISAWNPSDVLDGSTAVESNSKYGHSSISLIPILSDCFPLSLFLYSPQFRPVIHTPMPNVTSVDTGALRELVRQSARILESPIG